MEIVICGESNCDPFFFFSTVTRLFKTLIFWQRFPHRLWLFLPTRGASIQLCLDLIEIPQLQFRGERRTSRNSPHVLQLFWRMRSINPKEGGRIVEPLEAGSGHKESCSSYMYVCIHTILPKQLLCLSYVNVPQWVQHLGGLKQSWRCACASQTQVSRATVWWSGDGRD